MCSCVLWKCSLRSGLIFDVTQNLKGGNFILVWVFLVKTALYSLAHFKSTICFKIVSKSLQTGFEPNLCVNYPILCYHVQAMNDDR